MKQRDTLDTAAQGTSGLWPAACLIGIRIEEASVAARKGRYAIFCSLEEQYVFHLKIF